MKNAGVKTTDEIWASDGTRFETLRDQVMQDVKDRTPWFDRCRKNEVERYKRQNTEKPLYAGAPNLVDPVIDDLIKELKQSVVTTLWQAPRLAQFIGLDDTAVKYAEQVEAVFDFHLRRIGKTRARMSVCVDKQLTYGSAVAKMVTVAGAGGCEVPEFRVLSPLSVVVPTSTGEIADAQRVCHIFKFGVAEFRRAAKANGWDTGSVAAVLKEWEEKGGCTYTGDACAYRAPYRDGTLTGETRLVEVWEIYYETADTGRRVCVIAPALPAAVLYDRPWAWARLIGAEAEPPARPWPFVQFRYEDTDGYYNSRGIPEIIEVDQKEASSYRTARGVSIDFAGKPFVEGQRRATPFGFKAGEFLDGLKIVWAEPPDDKQTYQQEYARTLAMKRVGSPRGDISSVVGGDQRKTATEVKALMTTSNGMSVDAVDRFAEPWAELFGMMWQHLSRTVRSAGGKCGVMLRPGHVLPGEAWGAAYCVAAGVSGRAVTQTQTLSALTNMGQLAALMENMTQTLGPAAVKDFYLWIFQTLDSDLSRRVMAAAKGVEPGSGAGPEAESNER